MARRASGFRLFGVNALASAVPIAMLGIGLAHLYQAQSNRRALDQAASEADAIAARPLADYDKKLGVTDQASQNFIRVVYHSLKP